MLPGRQQPIDGSLADVTDAPGRAAILLEPVGCGEVDAGVVGKPRQNLVEPRHGGIVSARESHRRVQRASAGPSGRPLLTRCRHDRRQRLVPFQAPEQDDARAPHRPRSNHGIGTAATSAVGIEQLVRTERRDARGLRGGNGEAEAWKLPCGQGRRIDDAAEPSPVGMDLQLTRLVELVGAERQLMRDEKLAGEAPR